MFEKEILEEKSCRESWECVNVNIISKIIGETLWSTQQHEFEYQAAHAKYRAEQQSMIFSLINTICPYVLVRLIVVENMNLNSRHFLLSYQFSILCNI